MRVLVFGTFDGLHPGHCYFLREAQKRGDDLHIVIARDANVSLIKGHVPKHSQEARLAAVQEAFPSASVMLGDSGDFLAPIRAVKPDRIILGYDQKLPPGVTEDAFPCPIERLPAFRPERYKSRFFRGSE